jgi:hypothetical protein
MGAIPGRALAGHCSEPDAASGDLRCGEALPGIHGARKNQAQGAPNANRHAPLRRSVRLPSDRVQFFASQRKSSCANSGLMHRSKIGLLDHLVGEREQRREAQPHADADARESIGHRGRAYV